jgi:hypothetical protein
VTYQTTAPEANRSPQKLMLYELAPKVARIHCERRDEAVDVEDGRLPPSEWGPELENRRLEFIKRNLDIALGEFDSSDLFIAALFWGVPSTSGEFEVWKRCTPDWQARIARVRTKRRREYEAKQRKILEERALSTVAGHMARERKEQATEEIQLALRAAMMDPEATVRATPDAGERRQLDRAEIAEAGIDHVRNTLEVRGSVWCTVEVECPTTIKAPPVAPSGTPVADADPASPNATDNDTPSDEVVNASLVLEQARRIEANEPCGKNEVRVYLRRKYPHLSRDDADRFYEDLPSHLKPKSGPKGPWKNKPRSS